jgi:signal transduction histidine kinase/L-asparagine transporter-like permease/ActR/RegA family two-component response regulator
MTATALTTPVSSELPAIVSIEPDLPVETFPRHPRTIGWFGASSIAMGGSNQSLFLIGAVIASQGTAAVPLMIAGLVLGWMAVPGWIELMLMWPERVGGIAATCAEAFRPYSEVLANLTGVCYWWGWVPECAITGLLASSALHQWYLPHVPVTVMAIVIVTLLAALNLCGLKWASRLAMPMAIVAGLLALLSGLLPLLAGTVDWHRAASYQLVSPFRGIFGGITSAMAGLYLIGFAAPAFEAAACHVGEMRDPERNLPRAMYASAGMATLYFVVLPVIWLGVFGSGPLQHELSVTLGPTFAPLFGTTAKAAAVWFLVLNLLHGVLQPLSGSTRTLLQLAEDGLLPRIFARRMSRTDAPWFAIVITALAACGILIMGAPIWMLAAANFTYLIGICMPSVAVWLLRRNDPERARPYRARRGMIGLGVFAAGAWLVATLLGFEQFGLPTVLAGLALAYSGALGYLWRVVSDRRRAGLPAHRSSLHLKLTGAMIAVMLFDGAGYLLAITNGHANVELKAALQDIFVAVAILTVGVGLVLPGMIGQAAKRLAGSAERLAGGTLADLTRAMQALARGDLEAAHARKDVVELPVYSRDELGEMARTFNTMQREIARAAVALDGARNGIASANARLERHADEQAKLARSEQQARQQVELANRAKSEFLSRVSHELRTPLNAILGFGQLLEMSDLDEQQQGNIAHVQRGGEHLLDLVNQVLQISRTESGERHLPLEPVQLSAIIAQAIDLVTPIAEARRITLAACHADGDAWVRADLQHLKQVLLNLLSNAIKYNHDHGHVKVRIERSGDRRVSVVVDDDGPGIAAELMERLFTPFDRLGAEQTSVEGTGLGLALTKSFVEAMGGSIRVDSEPTRGTAFTIELDEAEPGLRLGAGAADDESRYAGISRPRRVLCIEDNPTNLELLEQILRQRPEIALLTAVQGTIGVELARQHHPDLVLLDLHLPDMSGEQVLKRLRDIPETKHVPVVVVSADATPDHIERLLAAGVRSYLTKPVDVAELLRVVDDALLEPAGFV